jgi:hypothetical protein
MAVIYSIHSEIFHHRRRLFNLHTGNSISNDGRTQMVTADSKCPKCGNGIMKLFPETKPLIPEPEQSELRARCTACNYEDTVTIRSDD